MRYLIAILALAGIFDSCLALRIHNQNPAEAPPCAVSEKFDCGVVNHGRYSVFPPIGFDEGGDWIFLRGVPVVSREVGDREVVHLLPVFDGDHFRDPAVDDCDAVN
jgi:hypothetical protein